RLDEVARPDPRLLARVGADERRALEHGVVEFPGLEPVGADRADERARLQPLAPQDGVARVRDGHDDVLLGRVLVPLALLRAVALAERPPALLVAAERDDRLDPRQRRADALDLRLG